MNRHNEIGTKVTRNGITVGGIRSNHILYLLVIVSLVIEVRHENPNLITRPVLGHANAAKAVIYRPVFRDKKGKI